MAVPGVSGTLFAHVLHSSELSKYQRRLVLLVLGSQTAWALEHVHSHGIWHLDGRYFPGAPSVFSILAMGPWTACALEDMSLKLLRMLSQVVYHLGVRHSCNIHARH